MPVRLGSLVLALLLLSAPLAADGLTIDDKVFLGTLPAYAYVAVRDATMTTDCVQAGRCREVNPLWAAIAQTHGIERSMAWKLAAQAGLAGGLGWAMWKYPSKKRYLVGALITMTVLQGVVNVGNARRIGSVNHAGH